MNHFLNDKTEPHVKIGVVIVNYNSTSCLLKALNALVRQSYKPDQVIIFDNASCEPIPQKTSKLNLPIKIIYSSQNIGFASGNNKAIAALEPSINWIALLNPDAYPNEDWLSVMVNAIVKYPQYTFWGSKLICEKEPSLLDGTGDIYHISGRAWRQNHRKALTYAPTQIEEIFSPCAAAALYRRDVFTECQGFDDYYFCYYEDIDLSFRLRLLGYNGAYLPEAIVEHTGSATTERHSDFYTYHGHRNLVWTYFKNMPLILLIITIPLHLFLNIATLVIFVVRGQSKTIFRAKIDALKDWPRIKKQRQLIQRNRKIHSYQLLKILKKGLPW